MREGLHYNPYFPGGAIAMPKMLNDGGVEYDDGTPATESQVSNHGSRASLVVAVQQTQLAKDWAKCSREAGTQHEQACICSPDGS